VRRRHDEEEEKEEEEEEEVTVEDAESGRGSGYIAKRELETRGGRRWSFDRAVL